MTENFELHLRDRLVAFSQGRVDVGAVLDARFPFEAADLSEVTQERHLDSIRTQLSGRTDERKPSWLAVLLRRQSGQYPASKRNWTMALVASVFLLVLLALLQSPVEKRTTVAGGTALPKKGLQKPDAPKDAPVAKGAEREGSTRPDIRVDRGPGSDASPSIAAKVEVGVFGDVMGEPTVRFEGETVAAVLPDMAVYASSIIETGDTDNAEIRLSDGTTVRMDFNTQIRLAKPLASRKSTLRPGVVTLMNGRVSVVAAHLRNAETFSIKTDVATATVIGTRFSLGVSGAGRGQTAVLKVQEGKVQFSNEHGSVIAISQTESSATRDDAPTRPRRLSILGQRRVGRGLIVTWHAEPRANDEKEYSGAFVFKMGSAGVRTMPLADRGVLIVGLSSPALAAGIQVGDVLTRFNGRPVESDENLHRWIRLHPNQHVTATLERQGKAYDIRFRLNEMFPSNVSLRTGLMSRLGKASEPALTGDPGSAVIALRALVRQEPEAPVFNNLGMAQFMEDDIAASIKSLKEAVRLEPKTWLYRYNLGRALIAIGNFDRGIEELQKSLKLGPDTTLVAGHLARALVETGRGDEAIAVLRSCVETGDTWQLVSLAYALVDRSRFNEAVDAANEATRLFPDFALAHAALASALCNLGRFDEAEAAARASLALDPGSAHAWAGLGNLHWNLEKWSAAEAAFRRALSINPGSPSVLLNLGRVLSKQGKTEEAEELFRQAIEVDPKSPHPYLQLGTMMADRRDLQAAEAFHRKAVEVDPESAEARTSLGFTLLKTGKFLEAEAECRLAIDLDPTFVWPYQALGSALRLQGEVTEAEAVLRRGIALDPKYVGLITELAILLSNAGRLADAAPYFKTAADLAPSASSYANLGTIYGYLGKPEDAEEVYREGLKRWPMHGPLLNNLADNLSSRNIKLEEARDLGERAVKASPADPFVRDTLGWIHYQLGEYDLAEKRILECIEIGGTRGVPGVVFVHLGAVYEKKGNIERARAAYKQAIAIEPNNKEASDALKRIGS